jgi:hypothetical protein
MDLAAFRHHLAQCGTDLEAWPDDSGAAALELMAGSVEARDAWLAAFSDASADTSENARVDGGDEALVERIMGLVAEDQG